MKKEDAAQDLRHMMICIQKFRANIAEMWGGAFDDILAKQWPWVFGDSCPLPALSKILDTYDRDGILAPMDYFNMMVVLHRFMPEVIPVFVMLGADVPQEPSLQKWDDD